MWKCIVIWLVTRYISEISILRWNMMFNFIHKWNDAGFYRKGFHKTILSSLRLQTILFFLVHLLKHFYPFPEKPVFWARSSLFHIHTQRITRVHDTFSHCHQFFRKRKQLCGNLLLLLTFHPFFISTLQTLLQKVKNVPYKTPTYIALQIKKSYASFTNLHITVQ